MGTSGVSGISNTSNLQNQNNLLRINNNKNVDTKKKANVPLDDDPIIERIYKFESKNELKNALASARTLNLPRNKALYLARIACKMSMNKINENEAVKIFNESLDAAFKIKGLCLYQKVDSKGDAIRQISSDITCSNLTKETMSVLLMKALSVAETIGTDEINGYADDKMYGLTFVVHEIASAKLPKNSAKELILKALKIAKSLEGYTHWKQIHAGGADFDDYVDCKEEAYEEIQRYLIREETLSIMEIRKIFKEAGATFLENLRIY